MPLRGFPDWQVRRFTSEGALRKDWPKAKREDDFWLRPEVLSFLVNAPQGITTEPLIVENKRDGRKFLITAQTFYFSAGGQVSESAKGETSGFDFRRRLLAPFSFRILSLGQFLVSGDYASDGVQGVSAQESAEVLTALADTLMARCSSYAGTIVKDLHLEDHPATEALRGKGYFLLPTDPLLQMQIPAHWTSIDDYLEDLKSKYRVRYRRARTKLEGINSRTLLPEEVRYYRERIYQLYKETASGSDFNAVSLTPEYFPWLAGCGKEVSAAQSLLIHSEADIFPGSFSRDAAPTCLTGYFNPEGEMIGFTSTIANGNTLHAHFLGMQESYKASHHLYHNILFNLLEEAIDGGFATLDYARTAPEIKTSIGAVAKNYAVLLRARSSLVNKLIPLFTPAIYKAVQWTARNPFPG